jgi:hypothetical protein
MNKLFACIFLLTQILYGETLYTVKIDDSANINDNTNLMQSGVIQQSDVAEKYYICERCNNDICVYNNSYIFQRCICSPPKCGTDCKKHFFNKQSLLNNISYLAESYVDKKIFPNIANFQIAILIIIILTIPIFISWITLVLCELSIKQNLLTLSILSIPFIIQFYFYYYRKNYILDMNDEMYCI